MTFRCYFCNFSAKRGEVTDKESICCQSTAQVDNTEHCYHTRLGKVKSPISQLYNFACAPVEHDPHQKVRIQQASHPFDLRRVFGSSFPGPFHSQPHKSA